LIEKSITAERCWQMLHLGVGSLLICNWYRPPSSDDNHIQNFREELANHTPSCIGCIAAGDMNIHHKRWLKYSNSNTAQGDMLKCICNDYDLHQLVRSPTRFAYLLDLVLSDIEGGKASVSPRITDHRIIEAKFPLPMPQEIRIPRHVWKFKQASWHNIICELTNFDWNRLHHGSVNQATEFFMECLWIMCRKYIPYQQIDEVKRSHPWLNDKCAHAIAKKNACTDTTAYEAAAKECTTVISEEYKKYEKDLRLKMQKLSKNDKRWWRLNR